MSTCSKDLREEFNMKKASDSLHLPSFHYTGG